MNRLVESELLDHLPSADAAARHSRRDLRRINRLMRNDAILARALEPAFPDDPPGDLLELGAGDGLLLARIARRLAPRWPGVRVRLLDRIPVVDPVVLQDFAELGWPAHAVTGEVRDWLHQNPATGEVVVTNLFIHHFPDAELRILFPEIALRARLFVAVEPRRGALPLFASRLLRAIGCNAVTCHDAQRSVRAGFSGKELSGLWPAPQAWELTERPAGAFSHLFVARRRAT